MTPEERRRMEERSFLRRNRTKLGHWVATSTPVRANQFDSRGRMDAANVRSGKPMRVPNTDFTFATSRPFALTKGQWKYLQSSTWLAPRADAKLTNVQLDLLPASGGFPLYAPPLCASRLMEGFQYHMVLLTNRQQKMKYLNLTDSVAVKDPGSFSSIEMPEFYFIVTNQEDMPLPLPPHALQWTTIAYLIWDDIDPDTLDIDQQQALVDWLHFGGQLILSGPDCLSKLENSFLADFLPAQSSQRTEIAKAQFAEINESWSVPAAKNASDKRQLTITEGNPMIGIELLPHVDAQFVDGTGQLVVERSLGRGRVVATAFSLADSRVKAWPSFQTFFSGALLRRPRREFRRTQGGELAFRWVDDATSIFDALVGSTLRFTSRDLGTYANNKVVLEAGADQGQDNTPDLSTAIEDETIVELPAVKGVPERDIDNTRLFGGFRANPVSGVAAMASQGAITNAARQTLKTAAGITPPSAGLVLRMLGMYLLVLVPLNWLLFRLIGKVEWAWIAIPFISIAGAFAVVKIASLDIGFARSNTQIAMLELHPDYPRGHLTRFSALYTSLSTKYDVELDNATGIALPFSAGGSEAKKERATERVTLHQSIQNRLDNFLIQSNSTRLLHAECLFDAGGSFQLVPTDAENRAEDFPRSVTIRNLTELALDSAAVIARDKEGNYHKCWLGDLASGSNQVCQLQQCQREEMLAMWNDPWDGKNQNPVEDASDQNTGEKNATAAKKISTYRLLESVVQNLALGRGEMRLLGYCNDKVGGSRFIPASTQSHEQTLILAHLKPAALPPVTRDVNSVLDFLTRRTLTDDESYIEGETFSVDDP